MTFNVHKLRYNLISSETSSCVLGMTCCEPTKCRIAGKKKNNGQKAFSFKMEQVKEDKNKKQTNKNLER